MSTEPDRYNPDTVHQNNGMHIHRTGEFVLFSDWESDTGKLKLEKETLEQQSLRLFHQVERLKHDLDASRRTISDLHGLIQDFQGLP